MRQLDQLISDHIAKYGVTRCPEAYATRSTGEISVQDRATLAARHAEMAEAAKTALSVTGPSRFRSVAHFMLT